MIVPVSWSLPEKRLRAARSRWTMVFCSMWLTTSNSGEQRRRQHRAQHQPRRCGVVAADVARQRDQARVEHRLGIRGGDDFPGPGRRRRTPGRGHDADDLALLDGNDHPAPGHQASGEVRRHGIGQSGWEGEWKGDIGKVVAHVRAARSIRLGRRGIIAP